MARKRRQYQIKTYKLGDFDNFGLLKLFKEGIQTGLAENQITELIEAIKNRKYIEIDFNYIPELIFLNVKNVKTDEQKSKLASLINEGLNIDGKKYQRFVRSTSMARTNKIAFMDEEIIKEMETLISLGKFDKFEEVIVSKFEGYMGLSFSTTLFVDAVPQNVCIVDDSIFDTIINDKVKGIRDGELIEGNYDVSVNLFDGMGLHSISWGNEVAKSLGIKETPPAYQIRLLPGFKGMSYEIDFKQFYKEKGITYITDKWNKDWNVEELDCIWSTSMFKLHKYFENWNEYIDLRDEYYTPLGQNLIGISSYSDLEVNPNEKTKMTYQYLQVLSLSRDEIVELSNYTKDTIERVYQGDLGATLAYLNLIVKQDYIDDEFDEVEDEILEENMIATKVSTAISCVPEMINDPYITQFLQRQLQKSINDAKLGRIWADGRYSYICQDPVMMLEMVAGLEPKGCLDKNEFYSTGEVGLRAFFRSPLTHSSEVHKANLIENDLTNRWLNRYKNIIVMNGKDITAQKISGSDFDGDKYFITKNPLIINRVITHLKLVDEDLKTTYKENLPVLDIDEQRNRDLVNTEKRTTQSLIQFDLRSLDNLIGRITNISTYLTTYAMTHNKLAKLDYELVYLRLLQGQEIDFSKHGVRTLVIPSKYDYMKQYKPYFLQKYKYGKNDFFQNNVNTSPMNLLCKNIENWENKTFTWEDSTKRAIDTSNFLMDTEVINSDKEETKRVKAGLEKVYADYRKDFAELKLMTLEINKLKISKAEKNEIIKNAYGKFYDKYYYEANQVTDDKVLLSSMAVYLAYIEHKRDKQTKSYQFPWVATWEGLIITLAKKQDDIKQLPVLVDFDSLFPKEILNAFEFLGNHYHMKDIPVKVDANKYIEEEYEKIVERELKKQVTDFELELVLVGFNDKSVEEVEQGILKKKLSIGTKEFKGKNYATIEGQDGYLASVRANDTKHYEDGYIDLTDYKGSKVKVKVLDKTNRSMTIKLKMVG